jgi:hypothetical protein
MDSNLYLVASRQGIFKTHHSEWKVVAKGAFFGIVLRGGDVYAFRHREEPQDDLSGEIVRWRWCNDRLVDEEIIISGLDRRCHQLDFFDGSFFLVDTADQSVREYDGAWKQLAVHQILPPADCYGPDHAHLNSITGTATTIWVMLHNSKRDRPSELLELDRQFRERRRIELPCTGCHDIVVLPDGNLLTCLSPLGQITVVGGDPVQIDRLWTRGLVVGSEEIVVGSSYFGRRLARTLLPGFVTFLSPSYERIARLHLPAAPTQIRRVETP